VYLFVQLFRHGGITGQIIRDCNQLNLFPQLVQLASHGWLTGQVRYLTQFIKLNRNGVQIFLHPQNDQRKVLKYVFLLRKSLLKNQSHLRMDME